MEIIRSTLLIIWDDDGEVGTYLHFPGAAALVFIGSRSYYSLLACQSKRSALIAIRAFSVTPPLSTFFINHNALESDCESDAF